MKSIHAVLPLSLALMACTPEPVPDSAADTPPATQPASINADSPPVDAAASTDATGSTAPPEARPLDATPTGTEVVDEASGAGDKAVNDAIDGILGDHEQYQSVITELKKSVAAGDAAAVSELVDYPISVEINGRDTMLKDKQEFVSRYKDFMTPEITKAIVDTKYSDLLVNYKGVMFGDGQAWINGICKDDSCKVFDVKLVTLQPGP